nr:MAG TPA_asm: hypothetical protein [Caudoviricetes sp.]
MENEINIAEILKDCSKGTKLYTPLFGEVTFGKDEKYSIIVYKLDGIKTSFTEEGHYTAYPNSECVLFPSSEMRDWTKFFKRGDIVIKKGGGMAAVFDGWVNDTYTEFNTTVNLYCDNNTGEEEVCTTLLFRKATEKERKQFIEKVERILKGKYNPETLQVETVKPECPFKPFGEKIKIKLEEIKELIEEYENEVQ